MLFQVSYRTFDTGIILSHYVKIIKKRVIDMRFTAKDVMAVIGGAGCPMAFFAHTDTEGKKNIANEA